MKGNMTHTREQTFEMEHAYMKTNINKKKTCVQKEGSQWKINMAPPR